MATHRSIVEMAPAGNCAPVEPRTETERRSTFLDRKQLAKVVDRPEDFASMHDHFNAILRAVAKTEGALKDHVAERAKEGAGGR